MSTVSAPAPAGADTACSCGKLLTPEELREELRVFAAKALREELAELRLQLRQDFQLELEEFDRSKTHKSSISPLGKPPLILDTPQEPCQAVFLSSSENNTRCAGYQDFASSQHSLQEFSKAVPRQTDIQKNEGLQETCSLAGVRNASSEFPHPVDAVVANQLLCSAPRIQGSHVTNQERQSEFSAHQSHGPQVRAHHSIKSVSSLFKMKQRSAKPKKKRGREMEGLEELEKATTMMSEQRAMHAISRSTRLRLQSIVKARPDSTFGRMCNCLADFIMQSIRFVIVLNGIFIGLQTDYQARNVTESAPAIFPIMESIFCVIFTLELFVNLVAHRLKFFYQSGWQWNIFDMFLVIIQLIEIVGIIVANYDRSVGSKPVGSVSFLRMLRILRVLRILRLVRLVRFVGELTMIISSIANSFRALCWTLVLLLMMIYIVGIFFSQLVVTHRVGLEEDSESLELYWGSVTRSILTLYQAILGGIDWETVSTPLEEISPFCAIVFCFYIAFSLLAMMNIITSNFVQSALKHSENEKTKDFRTAARKALMYDGQASISYSEFVEKIEGGSLKHWISHMDIEPQDAKLLYRLLETEDSKVVSTERLVTSLVSLREEAKFIDIMKLMYELKYRLSILDEWWKVNASTEPASVNASTRSSDLYTHRDTDTSIRVGETASRNDASRRVHSSFAL